jgi:Zn-dependent M28 family amino/carboxypeptidase
MDTQVKETTISLMEYVRALENKDSFARGRQVRAILEDLEIEPFIQECRIPRIKNIVVDYHQSPAKKSLIFSAHYDAVRGSPAANDNASGVAVLLGLCQRLRNLSLPVPVKIVFFDREESWLRTPFIRLGLLGSIYYVLKTGISHIGAVYNIEFCGRGDFLAVWPIKKNEQLLAAVRRVEKAAVRLNLKWKLAPIPWLFMSSDHLSFRLRGLSNSITISLMPSSQLKELESLVSNLNLIRLLKRNRLELPEVLSVIHTAGDSSSNLSEYSLRLMLDLLLEIIRGYDASQPD